MKNERGKDSSKREAQVKKLLGELESHKKSFEKRGLSYTVLEEDQLRAKLARAKSPMIIGQGWSGSVSAGSPLNYDVIVHNPDPGAWIWLFAHVFVGFANPVASLGEAAGAVDTRFPRLTQPEFAGLTLAANESQTLSYSLSVPGGIEPSNYQGNTFLYQADWHDVGTYFDRGTFIFKVT
jgi:hypothetical protein